VTTTTPEKITVTLDAPGVGMPLAADDAMRQFLDIFEMLKSAGGDEASPVLWELVGASMNSPITIVCQAVAKTPGVDIEKIAHREKAVLSQSLSELITTHRVPRWMDGNVRARAKNLFRRNTNGIGRTNIQFDDEPKKSTVIVESAARAVLSILETYERELIETEDKSRREVGSIDGIVTKAATFYGRPAVFVLDRITGTEIPCILSDDMIVTTATEHSWAEVYRGQRVLITGSIKYGRDGRIERIESFRVKNIVSPKIKEADIVDPMFTGGMGVSEYVSLSRRLDGA
jgi:hypothetical protein